MSRFLTGLSFKKAGPPSELLITAFPAPCMVPGTW